jgi:deazaflavin-dependent oxidoreductase (nitroreductase family)
MELSAWADEPFCYVTTTGRVTGNSHTIEIWFAMQDRTLYLLAGGGDRSDWVRNIRRNPEVSLRLGDIEAPARARVIEDPAEDETARTLVFEKYRPTYKGDLTSWRRTSLPVAIDL